MVVVPRIELSFLTFTTDGFLTTVLPNHSEPKHSYVEAPITWSGMTPEDTWQFSHVIVIKTMSLLLTSISYLENDDHLPLNW